LPNSLARPLRYERQLAPLDGFAATVRLSRRRWARLQRHRAVQARGGSPGHLAAPAWRWPAPPTPCSFDGEDIRAYNTDGPGLVADITRNAGVELAGRDLLLIGAGGAAAGVLGPLIGQQPRRIVIANRTVARAQELTQRHAALAAQAGVTLQACALDAPELADGFDVVVNATASSLGGAGVPVPASVLKPGALALDMMYGPAAQGFLDWARAHGARARDGLGMLVEQAAESFLIWRGVRPHSLTVLVELRAIVDSVPKA
jgi:shikimate dehydrogenase